jgi:hypothetical protein
MAGPVQRAVRSRGANGLVVIVTNDYSSTRDLSELKGTIKDGHALSQAFRLLGFAVCWERNVSGNALCGLVAEIRTLKLQQVRGYCGIIFVFAGHGCEGDYLWMQDGTKLHIITDIVDPLLPKNAKEIGMIGKAFLIDACRGERSTETVLVPRYNSIPNRSLSSVRGGSLMESLKVCEDGNFIVAYSTLPMHKAYESERNGGEWLSTLAKLLNKGVSSLPSPDLEYLLTEVNKVMSEKQGPTFQQPDRLSRLNGHITLGNNLSGCSDVLG